MDFITNSGVGIVRASLFSSLEDKYKSWNSLEAKRGPGAPGVDFMGNDYVKGFTPLARQGASDIRNIGEGGGGNFLYGNEQRIPRKVSDAIKMTYSAGPANSIQTEFQANAATGITRFTNKGLNYLDGMKGFDNTKYYG